MRSLLQALQTGSLSWEEAAAYFYMPGLGFHKSGFLLAAHTVSYRQTGHHTIAVPAHMQAALAATSLAGIGFKDLKIPHAAMYFAFPDSVFQLWGGPQTRWHPCGGVYVSYHEGERTLDYSDGAVGINREPRSVVRSRCLKLYFWGVENERSSGPGDDASFWFTINLDEMEENDWDFATYIERILTDPKRDNTHEYFSEGAIRSGLATNLSTPETIKDVHKLTRLVLNSLLYLTSPDAVIEQDPTAQAQQAELKNLQAALNRMKNKNKGKARRIQKRIGELPEDKILWIGGADPSAPQPTTKAGHIAEFVKEGSWWPRRDVLQRRIEKLKTEMTTFSVEGAKDDLAKAEGVEDIAKRVAEVATQQRWFTKKAKKVEALQESLNATRRWVPPHPNKGG
jgi:hypothetical protein